MIKEQFLIERLIEKIDEALLKLDMDSDYENRIKFKWLLFLTITLKILYNKSVRRVDILWWMIELIWLHRIF